VDGDSAAATRGAAPSGGSAQQATGTATAPQGGANREARRRAARQAKKRR